MAFSISNILGSGHEANELNKNSFNDHDSNLIPIKTTLMAPQKPPLARKRKKPNPKKVASNENINFTSKETFLNSQSYKNDISVPVSTIKKSNSPLINHESVLQNQHAMINEYLAKIGLPNNNYPSLPSNMNLNSNFVTDKSSIPKLEATLSSYLNDASSNPNLLWHTSDPQHSMMTQNNYSKQNPNSVNSPIKSSFSGFTGTLPTTESNFNFAYMPLNSGLYNMPVNKIQNTTNIFLSNNNNNDEWSCFKPESPIDTVKILAEVRESDCCSNMTETSSCQTVEKVKESRKMRSKFSGHQLKGLRMYFGQKPYLSLLEREAVAKELNLNSTQVKVWYQNYRSKVRHGTEQLNANEENNYDLKIDSANGENCS